MKAKQMSFYKTKLREVSKSLYREHGWAMPKGLADSTKRDPRNFTLHEWLQAKRAEQDPRDIKEALLDAWQISDTREAYEHALSERGYKLARGDRSGFVIIDHKNNIYAVPRWTGIKTKEVRAKLGSETDLPSIAEQQTAFAGELTPRIEAHRNEAKAIRDKELAEINAKRDILVQQQKRERAALQISQTERAKAEQAERQSRYRKGLRGLVDRFTGRHARIRGINEQTFYTCLKRDQKERDELSCKHIETMQSLGLSKADVLERYRIVREALLVEPDRSKVDERTEFECKRPTRGR